MRDDYLDPDDFRPIRRRKKKPPVWVWAALVLALVGVGAGGLYIVRAVGRAGHVPGGGSVKNKENLIEISTEFLSDTYLKNPAAADIKYKEKWLITNIGGRPERLGKETVFRYVRPCAVYDPKQPDVIFHFISEIEPAKMVDFKMHIVEGQCQGLIDGDIHITECRITSIRDYPPVPEEHLKR